MLRHTIMPGESLWSIVTGYGLHPVKKAIQKIININNLSNVPYLLPGSIINIPIEGLYYIVQPGDSLWYISKVFNIPVNTLASHNNLSTQGFIYPGVKINFPKLSNGNFINPGQYLICIDPGHQKTPNYEQELEGPCGSETADKVSLGTQGVVSKKTEYELNLEVALRLQYMLKQIGFKVLMIRTTNDVNISNSERAIIANNANADLCIHIHANDSPVSSDANGIDVLYPPTDTPCISLEVSQKSKELAQYLLNEMIKSTGANSQGLVNNGDITVFQWSQIPTALVEMGFMSNPQEDVKMSNAEYQNKLAQGMVNGIEDYLINVD